MNSKRLNNQSLLNINVLISFYNTFMRIINNLYYFECFQHLEYYKQLKENVLQYDLMIDKLIIKDITLTASNDDQYFVFEDDLYQVS